MWELKLKDVGIAPHSGLLDRDMDEYVSLGLEERLAVKDEFYFWLGRTRVGKKGCRWWCGNAKENLFRFFAKPISTGHWLLTVVVAIVCMVVAIVGL